MGPMRELDLSQPMELTSLRDTLTNTHQLR
jgi:hypothetical protein